MVRSALLQRVSVDPAVAGGTPCVRDTRIHIAHDGNAALSLIHSGIGAACLAMVFMVVMAEG